MTARATLRKCAPEQVWPRSSWVASLQSWPAVGFSVAAITLLAMAPIDGPWRMGAVAVMGAATLAQLWRVGRDAGAIGRALGLFSQRVRQGDVSGALRAVRDCTTPERGAGEGGGVQPTAWSASNRSPLGGIVSRFAEDLEVALGSRERRWQRRMRLSADWHWEMDANLRFTWISSDLSSLATLGVQRHDLVGHRMHEVSLFEPPEGGWHELTRRMCEHRVLRDVTLEVRRPGHAPVWVALNGRPQHDDTGRFAGYEGVGRDITEQRLAFIRLAESERRHALLAELSVDWYWQTDSEHRIVESGPVARELSGSRAHEASGQTRWELYPDGASAQEWAAHRAALDARQSFRGFEFAIRRGDAETRWVTIGGQPRYDSRGRFLGYHGVGSDITLRKSVERMLLDRNQVLERLVAERTADLEQSNRDLEAFARHLAHELRTPIGHISSLAELLASRAGPRLGVDERTWLQLQARAAREMSHTVTALLELARSATAALLLERVDLSALAYEVIGELPSVERRCPVEWVIEPGLAADCSPTMARVVLVNLLGNAAKFTRDVDAPRVEFHRDGSAPDGGFTVSDNGVGFDAAHAATLFQPFVRLHDSERFQGTGLGLSLVRRIVERHGGTVTARGEPGRGAEVSFRFAASARATADAGKLECLDA